MDHLIEAVVQLEAALCRLCSKLNPEVSRAIQPELSACKAALAQAIGYRVAEQDGVAPQVAIDAAQGVLEMGDADESVARVARAVAIEDAANRGDDQEV